MKIPWSRRIEELRQTEATLREQLQDMAGALTAANTELSAERAARAGAESLAEERLRTIEEVRKRADDAIRTRDEAMRLVNAKVIDTPPDLTQYKPVDVKRRRRDYWLDPDFVGRVEKISRGEKPEAPVAEVAPELVN